MRKLTKYLNRGIWMLFFMALFFTSCKNEVDDVFAQSASERMKTFLKQCDDILQTAPNGWRLDYQPANAVSYVSFIMKFTGKDRVYMWSNYEDESTTTYNLNSGEGPMLSFDTYSVIHTYADPSTTPLGEGYKGDFEFIIMELTQDSLVCKGRKNQDRVVFKKVGAGEQHKIRLIREMDIASISNNSFFHCLKSPTAATADVTLSDDKKELVFKEMKIAFSNGSILGILSFALIGLYIALFKGKTFVFAYAVSGCIGVSLLLAMVISGAVGTLIPLFFKKIHVDPAVASGPLITTVNDLVAVVSYYGLSWIFLINMMHLVG